MAYVTLASVIVFAGCGSSPAGPSGPTPEGWVVYGIVVDESGICIKDATATIIGGARHGEVVTQVTPCGAHEEHNGGFAIRKLASGEVVTVRGSAPGFESRDVSRRISGPSFELLEIWLVKSN